MELLDNGTSGQLNFLNSDGKSSVVKSSVVRSSVVYEFQSQKFKCTKVQLSKVQLSKVQLSMSSVVFEFSCQKYKRSVAQKIRYLEFNCLKFKCPALLKILYLRYRISDKSSRVPFHMIQSLYKLLVWSFIRKRHPSCKKENFNQSKIGFSLHWLLKGWFSL